MQAVQLGGLGRAKQRAWAHNLFPRQSLSEDLLQKISEHLAQGRSWASLAQLLRKVNPEAFCMPGFTLTCMHEACTVSWSPKAPSLVVGTAESSSQHRTYEQGVAAWSCRSPRWAMRQHRRSWLASEVSVRWDESKPKCLIMHCKLEAILQERQNYCLG